MNRLQFPGSNKPLRCIALSFLLALSTGAALAQIADESILLDTATDNDQYLAGGRIRISAPVAGDVTAAGREVTLEASVTGDAIVAGERIEISGDVLDDVRAAGRVISLGSRIDGHVVAAGAEITLAKNARVADWAWFAGQRIDLRGAIDGDLRAVGETVIVTGTVAGDADVLAESLRMEPGARIAGNLVWRGTSEPSIDPNATIGGQIIRKPIERPDEDRVSILGALFFVVSLTLLALVIGLAFPDVGMRLGAIARQRPWLSLGVALLVLIVTPAVIALCFATGVGFMVGAAVLSLFIAMLVLGTALGMLAIAHAGSTKFNRPIASRGNLLSALLLVALVIWVASWVPALGALILLLVWLLGIGTAEVAGYRFANAD